MQQWHYALFLVSLIMIVIILGTSLSKKKYGNLKVELTREEELYFYVKRFINIGIYDYSFDKYSFNEIKLEKDGLVVGGQCLLVDFLNFIVHNDLFYPVGFSYGCSIADEISKGSIGIFHRRFGLLTDYVDALEVVTSNGIHFCSRLENPKLFWAIRGAGAENFGIITKVKLRLMRPPQYIQFFSLKFSTATLPELLKLMTGDKIISNKFSAYISVEKYSTTMKGLYFGIPRRLSRILNSFPDSWSGDNYTVSYLEALNLMEEYSENNVHLKTYYIPSEFNEEQTKIMQDSLENIKGSFSFQFWMLGGVKHHFSSMNRGKNALILRYEWEENEEVDWQLDQMIALTQRLKLSTRNKCCLGLFDYQLRSHRTAYFGRRYRNLRKVKKRYDPHRVFETNFCL